MGLFIRAKGGLERRLLRLPRLEDLLNEALRYSRLFLDNILFLELCAINGCATNIVERIIPPSIDDGMPCTVKARVLSSHGAFRHLRLLPSHLERRGSRLQELQQFLIDLVHADRRQSMWCPNELFEDAFLAELYRSSPGGIDGDHLIIGSV